MKIKTCGRCYDEVDELFDSPCNEHPELLTNVPLGQYHCPECGAMLVTGFLHPQVCNYCLTQEHPYIDGLLPKPIK